MIYHIKALLVVIPPKIKNLQINVTMLRKTGCNFFLIFVFSFFFRCNQKVKSIIVTQIQSGVPSSRIPVKIIGIWNYLDMQEIMIKEDHKCDDLTIKIDVV